MSAFAMTLLLASLPAFGLLALAAWLAGRRVERVRVVDRSGRILAEVVLGQDADAD